MPKQRLITMGLLSKYPLKSSVLQKFLNAKISTRYTEYEKMHMVALWFTPELPQSWMRYQFEQYGADPEMTLMRLRRQAYKSPWKEKFKHIGQQNPIFIGQPEVERYYARRPPGQSGWHPSWVIPVIQDHIKQGMTMVAISEKYGIPYSSVKHLVSRRSVFQPNVRNKKPYFS